MSSLEAAGVAVLHREIIRTVEENLPKISSSIKPHSQTVIVLGETGVGKTTLIHAIARAELLKVGYNEAEGLVFIDAPEHLPGMKIGHSKQSETSIPHQWVDRRDGVNPENEVTYWDCAGLFDNRGIVQEVVNAIFLRQLFTASPKMKIIVMIRDDDLRDPRFSSFRALMAKISCLFSSSMEQVQNSMMLVVSQAAREREVSHVQANLQMVLDHPSTPEESRGLLRSFLAHSIAVFKTPVRDGEGFVREMGDLRQVVLQALQSLPCAENVSVRDALSEGCKASIVESYNMLNGQINDAVRQILVGFSDCVKSFAKAATESKEREKEKAKLTQALKLLKEALEAKNLPREKTEALKKAADSCGGRLQTEVLLRSLEQLEVRKFFEQFVEEKARTSEEAFLQIRDKLQESKVLVEKALEAVDLQIAKEKKEEEERKVAAAKKAAEEARKAAETAKAARYEAEKKMQAIDTKRIEGFDNVSACYFSPYQLGFYFNISAVGVFSDMVCGCDHNIKSFLAQRRYDDQHIDPDPKKNAEKQEKDNQKLESFIARYEKAANEIKRCLSPIGGWPDALRYDRDIDRIRALIKERRARKY